MTDAADEDEDGDGSDDALLSNDSGGDEGDRELEDELDWLAAVMEETEEEASAVDAGELGELDADTEDEDCAETELADDMVGKGPR